MCSWIRELNDSNARFRTSPSFLPHRFTSTCYLLSLFFTIQLNTWSSRFEFLTVVETRTVALSGMACCSKRLV